VANDASRWDAIVAGAGAVGLACAWRLRRRGLSVLVLDRDGPGAGASGVAAGMLAPVTEADFGEERLLALNLAGAARWPAFAAELAERSGEPTGFAECGALVVAADRDDVGELRRLHAFQHDHGLDVEWLPGSALRRLEPALSPRIPGGLLAPQDNRVDPAATLRALAAALAEGGTELRSRAVEEIVVRDGRVRGVRVDGGEELAAGIVVLATGAWAGALACDGLAPPVRPVKGQLLELRHAGEAVLTERIVRTPRCYVVDRGDGRVVIGATTEDAGFDVSVTAGGVRALLDEARRVLPDVDELELTATRAGLRPGTPDNLPLIGAPGPDGLLWATGHGRNGVLLAPITAEAVAAIACGEEPPAEVAPCAPARLGFAGRAG
jgi:glycine oxidase